MSVDNTAVKFYMHIFSHKIKGTCPEGCAQCLKLDEIVFPEDKLDL